MSPRIDFAPLRLPWFMQGILIDRYAALWDFAFDGDYVQPDTLSYTQSSVNENLSQDFILAHVGILCLAPNVSRWGDYSISYFRSYSQAQRVLDNIIDLATRHIFLVR